MNGLPYYKAYPRDFVEGTVGMPFELKAAYRLVLDLIYMQGGELPDDARYISGLLGCSVRAWKKYRQQLMDAGKIYTKAGVISNFRADKELETLAKLQDKQRENRARPNKNKCLESRRCNHTEPESDKKEETNVSSKKKASRLPADWLLPKQWGEWAMAEGLDEVSIRREAERFRDYWIAKSGRDAAKLDWQATWRNWVRKAIADKQPLVKRQGRPQPGEIRIIQGKRKVYNEFDGWVALHA